ncbi:MAG TPA: hypothetical protein VG125_33025 [Pirellulales bacterium]|jgi:hypothetical protein|nr:hypothetical protein [Pirellulales bacterium]
MTLSLARYGRATRCSLLLALTFCAWLTAPPDASAQFVRCPQSSVSLLTDAIFADAALLVNAQANFLVATGVSRKLHAEAASMEMDNSVKWVKTYFERRRLNREARAAENPGYIERLEKRQELYRRIVDKNLPAMGTDLSDDINKMLREILTNASYSVFMSDASGKVYSSQHNAELSADDRRNILVREGKVSGKTPLPIRIDDSRSARMRWPPVLRQERFEAVRKSLEDARESAIGDVKIEQEVTAKNEDRLKKAVDNLRDELAAYYRDCPKPMPYEDWLAYKTARCSLEAMAVQTFLLVETQNTAAFDGSYRFHGKTVAELLQHMIGKGLEFAPAPPGGQKTYERLYDSVRGFYLELVPEPKKEK